MEGADVPAGGVRVRVCRAAVAVEREPVASAEHPEVVVEGMVLLHHDHDVVDLGQRVGAFGQARVGQGSGTAPLGARRQVQGGRGSHFGPESGPRSCTALTPMAAAPTPSAPWRI